MIRASEYSAELSPTKPKTLDVTRSWSFFANGSLVWNNRHGRTFELISRSVRREKPQAVSSLGSANIGRNPNVNLF